MPGGKGIYLVPLQSTQTEATEYSKSLNMVSLLSPRSLVWHLRPPRIYPIQLPPSSLSLFFLCRKHSCKTHLLNVSHTHACFPNTPSCLCCPLHPNALSLIPTCWKSAQSSIHHSNATSFMKPFLNSLAFFFYLFDGTYQFGGDSFNTEWV